MLFLILRGLFSVNFKQITVFSTCHYCKAHACGAHVNGRKKNRRKISEKKRKMLSMTFTHSHSGARLNGNENRQWNEYSPAKYRAKQIGYSLIRKLIF